eukprot:scaffold45320_cov68-Phaeocystis_antarctica.AAC.5
MAPVAGLRLDVASRRLGSPRVAERAVVRGAEQVGPAGRRAIEPLVITEPRHVRAAAVVDASEAVAAQQVQKCSRACVEDKESA